MLSLEMAELKHLLHFLKPVTCGTPVKMTQENENVQNQETVKESLYSSCFSHHSDMDVLSMSASDYFFRDHGDAVDVAAQPSPQDVFTHYPAAEGSNGGSVQSFGQAQSSFDDTSNGNFSSRA